MSNLTFKRNIGKGKLLQKYMRESESEKVSRLLDGAFSEFWFNNLPKCHGIQLQSVNNPFNLSRLVYENETSKGIRYIGEGLIVTYPTKKFIDSLLRGMRTELPYEIKKLTFGDINALDYGFGPDEVLFGANYATPETDGVSAMFSIVVPVPKSDMDGFKKYIKQLVDSQYVYGYDLTAISELEQNKMDDVVVLVLQFEARFSKDKFKFTDILYHVSPLKNLPKIRKRGFVPMSKSSEFAYNGRVYLFNQCPTSTIVSYGMDKAEKANDIGFCMFTIQRKNLESLETFKNGKLDFYVDWGFEVDDDMVEAVFTYNNVPLSVIDDVCTIFYLDKNKQPMEFEFKK